MKSVLTKLFSSKIFFAVIGLILAVLAIWQEKSLDNDATNNAWILALLIDLISGAFIEGVCTLSIPRKYNFWNVASWLVGGLLGIVIMLFV